MRPMEFIPVPEVPEDAQIVDVRSPAEFAESHAAGSVNIPMEQMPLRYGELDLDSEIYLMCRSGGRSAQVCTWLERNGIDAVNISGGMIDWAHHGRPVERG
ncbi:sulfurtransferase [Corynebacterium sphenisci DSM 44792]|uniref:Sulfurtransferase n=2 Tax=Corynebacterium sphenisci TaxID=191493 RepID=A0A1L7CZT6_9CORY|nr:sulfurtransferase [Corynebacterium sphenisci DSM 44792]